MNTLFFFNYQREIPPFMLNELKAAAPLYDEIYYTSPSLTNTHLFPGTQYPNIHFLCMDRKVRLRQYLAALTAPLHAGFWKQLANMPRTAAALRALLIETSVLKGIELVAFPLIKKHLDKGNKVTIIGAWFTACAVAAAKAKKRFPAVTAHSLAHAFDVDALRNPFRNRAWAEFKHQWLDGVHFISAVKLQGYYQSLADMQIKERFGAKTDVTYLGSINNSGKLNPTPAETDKFHILTLSRTSPEKRLERLVQTLRLWEGGPLKWTHIGSGPLDAQLHALVRGLKANHPEIEVEFAGYMQNEQVKQWLAENPVHLLVNVSDTEGLPVSVMEAASFGIPCAATDVGGTRELINPEMGWLEPADFNPTEFAARLLEFSRKPMEEQQQMRRAAHAVWSASFNAAAIRPAFYSGLL